MPTKTNTFQFTLPIRIIHTKADCSLAVSQVDNTLNKAIDIIEINHHDVAFKPPLTEANLNPNTRLTATVSVLNGRGHALTLAPLEKQNRVE